MLVVFIREDEKVLIMSGTHGNPPRTKNQSGATGLTDESQLHHLFYKEDCQLVGVDRGRARSQFPLSSWDGLPTINKPAERMEPPPPGSFYADEDLKEMDFRLANMAYYFGHEKKLIDDINEVKIVNSLNRNISSV